jgi:cob(I)alamin adenosyltransferase
MKIYTRTGDKGETGLFGGGRVSKSHPRVEAYGTVDELSSAVGVALSETTAPALRARLALLQHDLFAIGATLATPTQGRGARPKVPELPRGRIEEMERWIDESEAELEPLREFILPGGARGAAQLHFVRTVCRRAERCVVALAETDSVDDDVIRYLNRLSDLLFVFARLENAHAGTRDIVWEKGERSDGAAGG